MQLGIQIKICERICIYTEMNTRIHKKRKEIKGGKGAYKVREGRNKSFSKVEHQIPTQT